MDIKNTIVSQIKYLPFKIKACVLYGSFARGSQTPDSDIDIRKLEDGWIFPVPEREPAFL